MKTNRLDKAVSAILRPIKDFPGFFFAVALLGCLPTVAFSIIKAQKILHFIGYAIFESVAFAYILTIIALVIKWKWIRRIIMAVCLAALAVWSLIEIGSFLSTGCMISSNSLALMLETDPTEASGFFKQYFTHGVVLALIAIILVFFLLIWIFAFIFRQIAKSRVGSTFIVVVVITFSLAGIYRSAVILRGASIKDLGEFLVWGSYFEGNMQLIKLSEYIFAPSFVKVPVLLNDYNLSNGQYDKWLEIQQKALLAPAEVSDSTDFNIVVVIGESFIKSHSQLYGYYLPTNPRLKAESDSGRLITFADVTTTANFTTPSLRNLMNLNDLSRGQQWDEGVYFPLVMKTAGFEVYHYDNQTVSVGTDRGISPMFYSPLILENVYSAISDSIFDYDGDFLNYVHRKFAPKETADRKLVIYHLSGQHFPYSMRYKGPGRFTAEDITVERPWLTHERRAEVADYDNATVYNDSVVSAIFARFKDSPSIVFYFSDHGEDCWDLAPLEARNLQMPDDPDWVERQFSVPFFVWMSQELIDRNPKLVNYLRQQSGQPFTLDHLGQLILTISGVESPYRDKTVIRGGGGE